MGPGEMALLTKCVSYYPEGLSSRLGTAPTSRGRGQGKNLDAADLKLQKTRQTPGLRPGQPFGWTLGSYERPWLRQSGEIHRRKIGKSASVLHIRYTDGYREQNQPRLIRTEPVLFWAVMFCLGIVSKMKNPDSPCMWASWGPRLCVWKTPSLPFSMESWFKFEFWRSCD